MLLKSVLTTFSLLSLATAFSIPDNLPDGLYAIEISNGTESLIRIDNMDTLPGSDTGVPYPGYDNGIPYAGSDTGIPYPGYDTGIPYQDSPDGETTNDDTVFPSTVGVPQYLKDARLQCNSQRMWSSHFFDKNGAFDQFWNACNGKKQGDKHAIAMFQVSNTAAAYFCDYEHKGSSLCVRSEWSDAVNMINRACTGGKGGQKQAGFVSIPKWKKSYGITTPDQWGKVC